MLATNVLVIFRREVRDQLRDRRTLFMIFLLPLLLYPILGFGIVKLMEMFGQEARVVVIVGANNLPAKPPLLNPKGDGFDPSLFDLPSDAGRLRVEPGKAGVDWSKKEVRRAAIKNGLADAVVLIPPEIREQLGRNQSAPIPITYDLADERSQITYLRVDKVLARWKERIFDRRRERDKLPTGYAEPVRVVAENVATKEESGASVWAKLFPFLLVMMALTGAFYPAVDLCAGEKERGTMETLLISPASRAEIVLGKFLTVMLASVATAVLNLASMGLTGVQLAKTFEAITPAGRGAAGLALSRPSLEMGFWMFLLLIPLAMFFSALCLALAVLAKSMKEGQYYMTPLYLVAMPLTFLTLMPGIELNLFYSLVPITGVSLLLRALMQGEYGVARQFFVPVLLPTLLYAVLALRWAINQFRREDVLFREAEQFDLVSWVRHLIRDKEPTPNGGSALLCFVLMLMSAWFMMRFMTPTPAGILIGQIGYVLAPPLILTLLLTSRPRRTLLLYWPKGRYLALAVGLALTLNPLLHELRHLVEYLFPIPEATRALLKQLVGQIPNLRTALLLMALLPAICEEVAFRGYILSGLRRDHPEWSAIVISALLFGFLHVLVSLFHQLFNAAILGVILGLLAVRSRSLLPGILFHFLNNALALLMGQLIDDPAYGQVVRWLYRDPGQGYYHSYWIVAGTIASAALLALLYRSGEPNGDKKADPALDPT